MDKLFSSIRRNVNLDPENKVHKQRLKSEHIRLGLEKPQTYKIKERKEDDKTIVFLAWNNPKKDKTEEFIPVEPENDFEIPIGCLKEEYYGHTPYATNFNKYMKDAEYPSDEKLKKSYEIYKEIEFNNYGLDDEDEYNSEWENNLLSLEDHKNREKEYFDIFLEHYKDNYFKSLYVGSHILPQTDNKKESVSTFVKHFLFWVGNNKDKYKDTNLPIPEEFDPYRIIRKD